MIISNCHTEIMFEINYLISTLAPAHCLFQQKMFSGLGQLKILVKSKTFSIDCKKPVKLYIIYYIIKVES